MYVDTHASLIILLVYFSAIVNYTLYVRISTTCDECVYVGVGVVHTLFSAKIHPTSVVRQSPGCELQQGKNIDQSSQRCL